MIRWTLGALLLISLGCTPEPAPRVVQAPQTRQTMSEIVESLQIALPLTLDEEAFSAPENQESLGAAIARLRRSALELEGHGLPRDTGFAVLSRLLALDAAEVENRFRQGRADETRYMLAAMIDTCVACHSRLPAPSASDLGRTLYEAVDASSLQPIERIRLEMATRQFDRALESIEGMLATSTIPPAELDSEGYLEDYLRVCIRVRQDLPRASRALGAWRERETLPPYLADLVDTWLTALKDLEKMNEPGDELGLARLTAEDAARIRRFPADRRSLVHDLVVSSLLNRAFAQDSLPATARAEAHYLLGLTALHVSTVDWLASPEAHLEASIRAEPGSEYARESYLLLEEIVIAGFSGSGGTSLPSAMEEHLSGLRELAGF